MGSQPTLYVFLGSVVGNKPTDRFGLRPKRSSTIKYQLIPIHTSQYQFNDALGTVLKCD
jgi:hypothetical protein